MSYEEAVGWLRGERSTANFFRTGIDRTQEVEVWLAQADAASCEQAYWVVRAHAEGLVPGPRYEIENTPGIEIVTDQ